MSGSCQQGFHELLWLLTGALGLHSLLPGQAALTPCRHMKLPAPRTAMAALHYTRVNLGQMG